MNAESAKTSRPPTHRLFLALWPTDPVKSEIEAHLRHWRIPPESTIYAPHDWHVTLQFIGHVPAARVPVIAAGVDVPLEPFHLVLDQPQQWPHGMAVLAASVVPAAMQALHDRLGNVLRQLDQPVEARPYRPHLTLARRAQAAQPPPAPPSIHWPVQGFGLAVSTGNRRQRYQLLREWAC